MSNYNTSSTSTSAMTSAAAAATSIVTTTPNLTVCPIDGPIMFLKENQEDEKRIFYFSSLNLKWDEDCQWNVHLGDVIAVRVDDEDDEDNNNDKADGNAPNGDNDNNSHTQKKWTKESLLDWNPFQELHPKKKGPKNRSSSSSSSSCKWRLGVVLALGNDVSRVNPTTSSNKNNKKTGGTAGTDTNFLYVQWLHRATETSFAKKLGETFRPYRSSDKVFQLPYILLSTSKHAKIAPHQVLPAQIDMLTKDGLGPKGINMEEENETNPNNDYDETRHFQLWKLAFHCPKRIKESGSGGARHSSSTMVPEEDNGDIWSKLSSSTALISTTGNSEQVLIPKPLRRGWAESQITQDESGYKIQCFRNGFLKVQLEKQKQHEQQQRELEEQRQLAELGDNDTTEETSSSSSSSSSKEKEDTDKENNVNKRRKVDTVVACNRKRPKPTSTDTRTTSKRKKKETCDMQQEQPNGMKNKKTQKSTAAKTLRPTATIPKKTIVAKKARVTTAKVKLIGKAKTTIKAKATSKAKASPGNRKIAVKHKTNKASSSGTKTSSKKATKNSSSDSSLNATCSTQSRATSDISTQAWGRPLSEPLPYRSTKFRYYDAAEVKVNAEALHEDFSPKVSRWAVSVGDVIAIQYELDDDGNNHEDEIQRDKDWYPFCHPWSPGQITALYEDFQSGKWYVSVRWLYRFHDLSLKEQAALEKLGVTPSLAHNSIQPLFEKSELLDCLLESVFPGHIAMTSTSLTTTFDKDADKATMGKRSCGTREDGLPEFSLLCQYRHVQRDKWSQISDWSDYKAPNCPLVGKMTLSGPLLRGLECVGKVKKKTLEDLYRDRMAQRGGKPPASIIPGTVDESEDDPSINACPSGPCLYECQGMRFFEEVELKVAENTLSPRFKYRAKGSSHCWTIRVGDVVPIRYDDDNDDGGTTLEDRWYPFLASWSPAQVLSIYEVATSTTQGSSSTRWMMEIRWFEQFQTLSPEFQTQLDGSSTDQPHVVIETDQCQHVEVAMTFPGRVLVTSSDAVATNTNSINEEGEDYWNVVPNSVGIPFIPRLCQWMCVDEEIVEARDWTNYDLEIKTLPPPLARGLQETPRNRTANKDLVLQLYHCYKRCIICRPHVEDEDLLFKWRIKKEDFSKMELNSTQPFRPDKAQVIFGEKLCETSIGDAENAQRLEFAKSVKLSMVQEHYVNKLPRNQNKADKSLLELRLGDVVCYANENAKRPRSRKWLPFTVKWSYGQVVAIYRDKSNAPDETNNQTHTGSVSLELRRLHRRTELPTDVEEWMPPLPDSKKEEEEIFETDETVTNLSASHVLAVAKLYLAHGKTDGNRRSTVTKLLPPIHCRCHYFYATNVGRFQPLYCSEISDTKWHHRFVERGLFQFSKWIQKFENLRTQSKSEVTAKSSSNNLDSSPESGSTPGKSKVTRVFKKFHCSNTQRNYFISMAMGSSWSTYVLPGVFDTDGNGREKPWQLSVGRIVAVKANDSTKISTIPKNASSAPWYPFVAPWVPCQVLAIFSDSKQQIDEKDSIIVVEVRVLSTKQGQNSGIRGLSELIDREQAVTTKVRVADILCPLTLFPRDVNTLKVWRNIEKESRHMPVAPVIVYPDSCSRQSLTRRLKRSNHYSDDDVARLVSALVKSDPDEKETTSGGEPSQLDRPGGWISVAPFHSDASSLRAFYSELQLFPPNCNKTQPTLAEKELWTVSVGDIVGFHTHTEDKKRKSDYGVAEVVCIFREFKSESELKKQQTIPDHARETNAGEIMLEVRWFYFRNQISGITGSGLSGSLEELFETDELDVVKSDSILDPVVLHSDPHASKLSERRLGMPVKEYFCGRFWSLVRKSLIPRGSADGMKKRGQLYSKFLTTEIFENSTAPAKSIAMEDKSITSDRQVAWKDAFTRVIKKLTLKDASREAYDHGAGLIGREKELSRIVSFLRGAIRGDAETGGVKSSIFLAGPPGVGKTACVRAAIARLQSEKAKAKVPPFSLISLNGMEMRHPYEAYVRLWENLSGNGDIRTPDEACKKLESYFTSPWEAKRGSRDRAVSVVLLDEIDYLVTEKQSVLYNMFDWPRRALEVQNGKRLVVIGISNTLNLADQLMPSIQSRVGMERCSFKAYNLNDTVEILTAKINQASPDYAVFENDAIVLAAKKTAALCGDIRKAFQIGRAAAEMVMNSSGNRIEENQDGSVTSPVVRIGDVQKAGRASFNMALVTAVSFATPFQALLLVALASLSRSTGRESGGFDIQEVLTKMHALAGSSGCKDYSSPPSFGETIHLLNRMGESNLVQLRTSNSSFRSSRGGGGGAWPLISLAVDENTILRGLRGTTHQALAEKNLTFGR